MMISNNKAIPLVWDKSLLDMNLRRIIHWRPERHPMLLAVGSTGTGKSYFLSLLMAKISLYDANSQLFLCDYKDIDFRTFAGCTRRWSYDKCTEGLTAFYESFQERLCQEDNTTHRKYLIFDEFAAFVLSLDKKPMENAKSKLSTLLMMGRGVQHHVIIGLQRADASLFPLGGRDQFGAIVALGNLSREQTLMILPDSRELMNDKSRRGQGYLSFDGERLKRIQVPTVKNFDKLNNAIHEALTR